jgi:hypothetical protein
MDAKATKTCPHCGGPLVRWENPDSWQTMYQLVCFNDECSYFVRGWLWMNDRFNVNASYRFRLDPSTGEEGPLPVWSKNALRSNIAPDSDKETTHAG